MDNLTRKNIHEYARRIAGDIRGRTRIENFGIGIITGTGGRPLTEAIAGASLDKDSIGGAIESRSIIPYSQLSIPGAQILGQAGMFAPSEFKLPDGSHVACFFGRSHLYGFSADEEKLPLEDRVLYNALLPLIIHYLLKEDGIFITTRAAGGGVHAEREGKILRPRDIGVVSGIYAPDFDVAEYVGSGFLDRKHMPNQEMVDKFKQASEIAGIPVYNGTLWQPLGPSFETGHQYIDMFVGGIPLVCIGDREPDIGFAAEMYSGRKEPRRDLHICLVSDSAVPTLEELRNHMGSLLGNTSRFNDCSKLYPLLENYIRECGGKLPVVTHEENLRNAEATMGNVMEILHHMIGELYGIRNIEYKSGNFLRYRQ